MELINVSMSLRLASVLVSEEDRFSQIKMAINGQITGP